MLFRSLFCFFTLSLVVLTATPAHAQDMSNKSASQNVSEMTFSAVPGLPPCIQGAVQNGDPAKGPSIVFAKVAAGCVIPWHWHTANEHLMIVSGVARIEMKDGKPLTLRPGGFARMPSRHVHQFSCENECSLYVYSDAAFDITFVDSQGKKISADDALKSAKPPQD
jgi:mannose-6-phosphate isomerase-like protein (cupin superfamily)